jgi:hypothetical protein
LQLSVAVKHALQPASGSTAGQVLPLELDELELLDELLLDTDELEEDAVLELLEPELAALEELLLDDALTPPADETLPRLAPDELVDVDALVLELASVVPVPLDEDDDTVIEAGPPQTFSMHETPLRQSASLWQA